MASFSVLLVSRRTTFTAPARALLELAEDAPADAEAAGARRDPHALDLGRLGGRGASALRSRRLAAQAGDEEQSGGLGELVDVGRDALAGIEAGVEAGVELGEVGLDAEAGRRAGGVLDVDGRRAPAVSRRSTTPIASTSRSRWPSLSETSSDEASSSLRRSSRSRSARPASVRRTVRTRLSPAPGCTATSPSRSSVDQAAQVAGVEVEPRAQGPQVGAVGADLPQHPRGAERPAAGARYSSFSAPMRCVTLRVEPQPAGPAPTARPAAPAVSYL